MLLLALAIRACKAVRVMAFRRSATQVGQSQTIRDGRHFLSSSIAIVQLPLRKLLRFRNKRLDHCCPSSASDLRRGSAGRGLFLMGADFLLNVGYVLSRLLARLDLFYTSNNPFTRLARDL
jgi:hypothetical protein